MGAILRIRGPLTLSIDEVHSCDGTIGLGKDIQLAVSTQVNLEVCFKPPVQYVMQILVNKLTTWCATIVVVKRVNKLTTWCATIVVVKRVNKLTTWCATIVVVKRVNKLTTWCATIVVVKRAVCGMIAFLLNVLGCL